MGTLLYLSYAVCSLLLMLTLYCTADVFFNPFSRELNPFDSISELHNILSCVKSDTDNKGESALSFTSTKSMMEGIVTVLGNMIFRSIDNAIVVLYLYILVKTCLYDGKNESIHGKYNLPS